MRYELHIGDKIIYSTDKDYLLEVAKLKSKPWVLYGFQESRMNKVKISKYKSMELYHIDTIHHLLKRGYSKLAISKKYHIGMRVLNRIIQL